MSDRWSAGIVDVKHCGGENCPKSSVREHFTMHKAKECYLQSLQKRNGAKNRGDDKASEKTECRSYP